MNAALGSVLLLSLLAASPADPDRGRIQAASASCAACHHLDGNNAQSDVPKLAGQNALYQVRQLRAYKAGNDPESTGDVRRHSLMSPLAARLSEQDMVDISAWYASKTVISGRTDPELAELGARLFRQGVPERGIAPCASCHGAKAEGAPRAGVPALAGQHEVYLRDQLLAYRSGERRAPIPTTAGKAAGALTDKDIEALATWLEGVKRADAGAVGGR